MVRRFKTLGFALVAVLAMSAAVVAVAQATGGTLTTEEKTVIATAEQTGEHEFALTDHETESGKFANSKCKKAIFTGTAGVTGGATSVQVHPALAECTAFGQPATITTTNCDYLFKFGTPTAGGWHATTDIVCSGGSVIKIVTGTCEVTIGAQSGLTTSEVTNSGSSGTAMDLLLHTNITGIKYTVVKDNIGCPLKGTGVFSKGDQLGTTTVKAHDATTKAAVGVTVHSGEAPPHQPSGLIIATGEQVGENILQLTDHLIGGGSEPANAKCKIVKSTGTEPVEKVEKTLRIHPELSECTAFGQPATITTTNCDYLLNIGSPTAGGWHVTTDVVCSGGSVIKIVTGTCEVTIGAQSGLTTSEVTNSGTSESMDLLLHTSITGIHYTVVKDAIGCPLSGTGNFSKGDYTGTATIRAHDSGNKTPAGVTVTSSSSVILTGEQVGENTLQLTDHLISGQPASVKCSSAKFTGTKAVEAVVGELQVHPVFEGCTAFGSAATITTTNCDYLLNIGSPTAGGWHVTTDVVCSGGSVIKIVTGNCEVTISAQKGLTTSEIENSGTEENMDMLLHTSIAGVHYTVAKDGSGCPLSGTGNFSQGDYTGTTTVGAHDSKTLDPVGLTKS